MARPEITVEAAKAALEKAGNMRAAGKLLGCDEKVIKRRLRDVKPAQVTGASVKARTIDDYKAIYDLNVIVPNKIKAGLAKLVSIGPEHFEYEPDFIKLAGITQTQVTQFRDQFSEHIIETPTVGGKSSRRVYFGSAKVAAKLRGA